MEPLLLDKGLVLYENAVFLPLSRTLIVADLQLGAEGVLRAAGQNVRYEQANRMSALLERLLMQSGAVRLVINGDLKHEFGKISCQERHDVSTLLRQFSKRVELVLVRGNHDTLTQVLAQDVGLTLQDAWSSDGVYVLHGHREPDTSDPAFLAAHTVVIGHMHPAVRLSDGVRSERYKCFLVGKYGKKRLLVLPSLATMSEGSDILTVAPNTPLLTSKELEKCDVYVLADEIRKFATVQKLRKLLEKT